MERVTPQHPVRRRCTRLKPVHEVPAAHAAQALAMASVEDDRVARLHGQTQCGVGGFGGGSRERPPEALAGRPVHWRGATRSVESWPEPQGACYALEAQEQERGPNKGAGRVASAWPCCALLQAAPSRATYGYRLHPGLPTVTGCTHLELELGLRQVPAHRTAVVEAVLYCDRNKLVSEVAS